MNWVRPLHRWVLDPVYWCVKQMVQDMLSGIIKADARTCAFWIRVLIMLSPRDGKDIELTCYPLAD